MNQPRLYLSPPSLLGDEERFLLDALRSGWIAPLGPHVDAFEREFAMAVDAPFAVALSSGTAALHLALLESEVGPGDEVVVSSLTFAASAFAVTYLGARPVFVDSEAVSWNIDPALLEDLLHRKAKKGRLPKAVMPVHLYGQSADLERILAVCGHYGIPVIEDAAEALGATYRERTPGTFGRAGVFSFNGNKILTTSGGGMLVTADPVLAARVRKRATQAREPAPHYEHTEIGFNYRLSNLLAAVGRAQLLTLEERLAARLRNCAWYREALAGIPGVALAPEAPWGHHARWLTCLTIDPRELGADRERVRLALEAENIEARPVWKPMHQQPVFAANEVVGGAVSERLFASGLCLPSGYSLTEHDVERVAGVIRRCIRPQCRGRGHRPGGRRV